MLDHDLVERFKAVNRSKCLAVFLHDAKPSGMIGRVRGFINTCFDLPLDDCTDVFEDARWNRDVAFNPGGMWNDGELDRGKEISLKVALFIFVPCEASFVTSNEIMHDDVTHILQPEIPHITIPYTNDIPIKGPKSRYQLRGGTYE